MAFSFNFDRWWPGPSFRLFLVALMPPKRAWIRMDPKPSQTKRDVYQHHQGTICPFRESQCATPSEFGNQCCWKCGRLNPEQNRDLLQNPFPATYNYQQHSAKLASRHSTSITVHIDIPKNYFTVHHLPTFFAAFCSEKVKRTANLQLRILPLGTSQLCRPLVYDAPLFVDHNAPLFDYFSYSFLVLLFC